MPLEDFPELEEDSGEDEGRWAPIHERLWQTIKDDPDSIRGFRDYEHCAFMIFDVNDFAFVGGYDSQDEAEDAMIEGHGDNYFANFHIIEVAKNMKGGE